MKKSPGVLAIGLLVAGCAAVAPVPVEPVTVPIAAISTETTAPPSAAASIRPSPSLSPDRFAYRIDPSIVGRRGFSGDFAFVYTPDHPEPRVIVFGEDYVVAFREPTARNREDFSTLHQADLGDAQLVPPVLDGQTSLAPRYRYPITFDTSGVSLDDLDKLGESSRDLGAWVFSSERAAKICRQLLNLRSGSVFAYFGEFNQVCLDGTCPPNSGPPLTFPSLMPPPASPTPPPTTRPLRITAFECRTSVVRLGEDAVVHVDAWLPSGMTPVKVTATVDDERREVRLEGKQVYGHGWGGTSNVSATKVGIRFRPTQTGIYRVIGTVDPDLPRRNPREVSCEILVRPQTTNAPMAAPLSGDVIPEAFQLWANDHF